MTPRIKLIDHDGMPQVAPPRRDRQTRGDLVLSLLNVAAGMSDRLRAMTVELARMEARVAELERQIAAERDGTP